ncbi:MAG: diaminopimelate epimerase [Cyanobacteriota bacterium]|nr:diaminopimelate epimerase [Cyanobacteriota bacterium]
MLHFSKYQGLGNDFLLVDARQSGPASAAFAALDSARVQRLCDRRFGVGADGVIAALPPQAGGDVRMRIYNADGSEPEMCGNGIRCLARFLADSDGDAPGRRWQVETLAGRIVPELLADGTVRVDMGAPFLEPQAVPTTLAVGGAGLPQGVLAVEGRDWEVAAVGMGNPHVVIPVADVAAIDLERFGAALEVHEAFPAKVNVHFVQVLSPEHLVMRVWERGAGPTLACGTGACATLVACQRLGLCDQQARVDLPGGTLSIAWSGESGASVWMSGPAEAVFDGMVTPELWGEPLTPVQQAAPPISAVAPAADADAAAAVDCATVCVNGCIRPEACPSAEVRARAMALLETTSLDDLVNLAAESLESRTRARIERGL